jgi:hypothetical protein
VLRQVPGVPRRPVRGGRLEAGVAAVETLLGHGEDGGPVRGGHRLDGDHHAIRPDVT